MLYISLFIYFVWIVFAMLIVRLIFSKNKKYLLYSTVLDIVFLIWVFLLSLFVDTLNKIDHGILIILILMLFEFIFFPLLFIKVRGILLNKNRFKLSYYFFWQEFMILFLWVILWSMLSIWIFKILWI